MSRIERILVWAIVGALVLWLVVLTVVTFGELSELWRIAGQIATVQSASHQTMETCPALHFTTPQHHDEQ